MSACIISGLSLAGAAGIVYVQGDNVLDYTRFRSGVEPDAIGGAIIGGTSMTGGRQYFRHTVWYPHPDTAEKRTSENRSGTGLAEYYYRSGSDFCDLYRRAGRTEKRLKHIDFTLNGCYNFDSIFIRCLLHCGNIKTHF